MSRIVQKYICEECKTDFSISVYHLKTQKFCCTDCRETHYKEKDYWEIA